MSLAHLIGYVRFEFRLEEKQICMRHIIDCVVPHPEHCVDRWCFEFGWTFGADMMSKNSPITVTREMAGGRQGGICRVFTDIGIL